MADRKPLKVLPDGGGDSTGLGEFVAADTVGIVDGGTGLATVGSNQLLTGNGTSALTSESNLTFDGNDLFIANGGGMVIGHTSQLSPVGYPPELQVLGTGDADTQLALVRYSNSGSGTQFSMTKSRNASIGGSTIVQDDDQVGIISWNADDGTTTDSRVAAIEGYIDGTPGENDMPGRLVFSTTADGGTSLTERMRIGSDGNIGIKCTDPTGTGSVQAHDLVIGNTGLGSSEHTGITLMAGTGGISRLDMGDTAASAQMGIYCSHSDDTMNFVNGPSVRATIDSDGDVMIGTSTSLPARLNIYHSSQSDQIIYSQAAHASYNGYGYWGRVTRAANTAYYYAMMSSSNGSDHQFVFRGDGQGQADLVWEDNAMDYAEYFESSDGSALEVGRSVVMDGDKVRVYDASSDSADSIVGVVRPKGDARGPSKHGSAWNHWHKKHLTDDYGTFLREDVTVWEWDEVKYADGDELPEGKEVGDVKIEAGSCYERDELAKNSEWTPPTGATSSTQSVRKRNPDYDESLADDYKSREFRDEWAIIGLLGQVPVKANEATNPRWIKMKQISDAVDLWLVR